MNNDKKKLIVIGGLVIVILGVGVFQLTSGGAPAPEKTSVKKSATKPEPVETTDPNATEPTGEEATTVTDPNSLEGVASAEHGPRDPFNGGALMSAVSAPQTGKPGPKPVTRVSVPPMAPIQGDSFAGGVAPLPVTGGGPGGEIGLKPAPKLPMPDDFNYTLSGVITGERPAAVFTDDKGNQQLIQLGGSLGPDTKVVKISGGRVTVKHRGKTKTLSVGGEAAPAVGGDSK